MSKQTSLLFSLVAIAHILFAMPVFSSTTTRELVHPSIGGDSSLFLRLGGATKKKTDQDQYSFLSRGSSIHWPHRPVFVQAGEGMEVIGMNKDQPIPLGVPFDFESDLFKGQILLRFRNAKSDDAKGHEQYFEGRKRLMQTVLQGRFKRRTKMSEVYAGSLFDKPLAGAPPPAMTRIMDAVIRRVAPGLILDLASQKPKVIALLAGTAQTMSIDMPGEQPDITLPMIPENVASTLGNKVKTSGKRKKFLGQPKNAAQFEFDTDHVYTFHSYDDAMDYGRGSMHIPMYGEFDIKPSIGAQPLSLSAVTNGGDTLYDLRIWHEDTMYAAAAAATTSQPERQ